MNKTSLIFLFAILAVFPLDVLGWSSTDGDPGREHAELSEHLFYAQPYFSPYMEQFDELSLNTDAVVYWSNEEVPPGFSDQWKWEQIDTLNDLYRLTISNYNLGAILHAAQDSGVPASHRPGKYFWPSDEDALQGLAHDSIEHTAKHKMSGSNYIYYKDNPPLTYSELLNGNWFEKRDMYISAMEDLTIDYRGWFLGPNGGQDTHNVDAIYVQTGLLNSLKWSHTAFTHFMDYYEITEPGSTIAHWEFENWDTQISVNSRGSHNTHLQLGKFDYSDSSDPSVSNGYFGQASALHCKGWTEAGNRCIFARNTNTWMPSEADSIAPNSSYTIEVVFNVEDFITNTADPNYWMGILSYRDNVTSKIQYRLVTYKDGSDDTFIEFRSDPPGDASPNYITFNTTDEGGMTISTNHWYYLAAIFRYETGKMDLILRDMETGKTASKLTNPMTVSAGFGDTYEPVLLIGSATISSGKCFDGLIDDVRLSNRALNIDADRLYNSTLAHWRFDESSGQTVYNAQGVEGVNLQLGNDADEDSHDPCWSSGYWGMALHGNGYVDNGNVATYALADPDNGYVWSLATANALVPSESYTIEAVFNVEEYPSSGSTVMGIVDYTDYVDPIIRYRIRTYKSGSNTYIDYQSGSTAIAWNTTVDGMDIIPGRWYYIGVFFNAGTNKADLILRDLDSTNGTFIIKSNNTMQSMVKYSESSRPVFFVGTDTFNGKSFDGSIDEVRISNSYLAEKDRLYVHGSTIAHWKFDYDYPTAGQLIDNVDKDLLLPLSLGATRERFADGDIYEPVLEPRVGWYAGSIHLGENGALTYALADPENKSGWFLTDANAAAPAGSYSVEAIFNADVLSSEMGIVRYADYSDSNVPDRYRITTYSNSGNTYIRFTSGNTTVAWNTKSADLKIIPGKWYYVGAFFDEVIDKVYLVLRDMQAGTTKTSSGYTVPPLTSFSSSSRPVFFVGTATFNSKGFDGYIDEVRISNTYLPPDCRLYASGVFGNLPGDLTGDNKVNWFDFTMLASEWSVRYDIFDLKILADNWLLESSLPGLRE